MLFCLWKGGDIVAIKVLKDKSINVRATDMTKFILDSLCVRLGMSQSDVIELALIELNKCRKG